MMEVFVTTAARALKLSSTTKETYISAKETPNDRFRTCDAHLTVTVVARTVKLSPTARARARDSRPEATSVTDLRARVCVCLCV